MFMILLTLLVKVVIVTIALPLPRSLRIRNLNNLKVYNLCSKVIKCVRILKVRHLLRAHIVSLEFSVVIM